MKGFITIDTLYLHVKYPKRDIFEMFYQRVSTIDTRILKNGIPVNDFVVKTGACGYKIGVWQHDARVYLTDQVDEKCGEGQGMGIWVQLGPKFLLQNVNNLHEAVIEFLRNIGIKKEYPISITRIDIAIDLLGVSMKDQDVEFWKMGWVGRSKVSKVFYNSRTGILESIYIGSRKSSILLRIYDKVAQSIVEGDYPYWLDVWKNYEGSVTRIEWEVKPKEGNFSKDLTDFEKFIGFSIRELLVYLLDWGRLCYPDSSDGNRNRWVDSSLWEQIRKIVADWSNGTNWPTSRHGKEFHGINDAYMRFLSGTISGGMAKLNPSDPSMTGLFEGLEEFGQGFETINRKAKIKAEIIKRL